MYEIMALTFLTGYILIALEHPLKIDKAAAALVTGVILWTMLAFARESFFPEATEPRFLEESLLHHFADISQILFFLLGAMTIVELVDAHRGFDIITDRIRSRHKVQLIWIIGFITFFLSAVLDNLTTSIVMAALIRKLIHKKEDLWFFAGMVVIAANAGGAWSPIGDVTTIMLWIGGQISALSIIKSIFLPSLVNMLVPLAIASFMLKGSIENAVKPLDAEKENGFISRSEQSLILWMGILGLLFVPVFKNLTHLPPFMGMMLSLGILWITTEIIHRGKDLKQRQSLSIAGVIRKIDTPSVLFFLGILLAVTSLQVAGHLTDLANAMDRAFASIYWIDSLIGLLSAIVDNVPLVAGAMGMYSLEVFPKDHVFWELLAYTAGTGGSILIIGSAAGVATMGILKIDFIWYLKKISWLALAGYLAGILAHYLLNLSTVTTH